jgi:hypothetical protein
MSEAGFSGLRDFQDKQQVAILKILKFCKS